MHPFSTGLNGIHRRLPRPAVAKRTQYVGVTAPRRISRFGYPDGWDLDQSYNLGLTHIAFHQTCTVAHLRQVFASITDAARRNGRLRKTERS